MASKFVLNSTMSASDCGKCLYKAPGIHEAAGEGKGFPCPQCSYPLPPSSSPSANQYFPLFLSIPHSSNTALTLFPTHSASKAGTQLLISISNDGRAHFWFQSWRGDADPSGFVKQTNTWNSREQEMKPGSLELHMRVKVQSAPGLICVSHKLHIFIIWSGQM